MLNVGVHAQSRLLPFIRQHRGLVARMLALDLLLMPLVTWLVVLALDLSRPVAVGMVLLAVAPGVPLAPKLARVAAGSEMLAIARVVLAGAITAFTGPASARLLLGYQGQVDIHAGHLILRLVAVQWLPLAAGIALHAWRPRWAARVEKITSVVSSAALGLLIVVLIVPRLPVLGDLGWGGFVAALTTTAMGWALGFLTGGHEADMRRTMAATTSPPNVGLSMAILTAVAAPPQFGAAVFALFLVKALANLVFAKILGQRAAPRGRRPWHGKQAGWFLAHRSAGR